MSALDALGGALLLAVITAATSLAWSTLRLGISPLPTSRRVRDALLALAPPALDGEVHELGAGWGGLALALADRFPKAHVVAWELSFVPWAVFRLRLALRPRPNLTLRRRDFFDADLSGARLVVCYLWTGAMLKLGPKLQRELPRGAVVLSQTFALRGWTADETRVVNDLYRTPVYRYVVTR